MVKTFFTSVNIPGITALVSCADGLSCQSCVFTRPISFSHILFAQSFSIYLNVDLLTIERTQKGILLPRSCLLAAA